MRLGLQRPRFSCVGGSFGNPGLHGNVSVLSLQVATSRLRDLGQSSHSHLQTLSGNITLVSSLGCSEPPPQGTQSGESLGHIPNLEPLLFLDTSRLICGAGVQGLSPCPLGAMNFSHHSAQVLHPRSSIRGNPPSPSSWGQPSLKPLSCEQCYSAPRQLRPPN